MKQYHKNPRQISGKQFDQLSATLQDLGDLSGIVHDLNSDEIIGGNQRSKVFDINDCQIELVDQYDAPDEQGTVAHGFIIWHDKRYAYRQVRWTPQQCEKANIVANKAGGSWDFDVLANEFELDDLLDWGFEAFELGLDEDDATESETEKLEDVPEQWAVMVQCQNEFEQVELLQKLSDEGYTCHALIS